LEFVYDHFNTFLRQFAFLNPGLKIISIDNTTDELQRNVFNYPTGVLGELDYYIAQQPFGDPLLRIEINAKVGEYSYKVGISYSNVWIDKSFFKTYAGNVETYLGGSFDEGILEGIISAIRHVARKENADVLISRKLAKEQLTVVAAVQGEDFEYEGSTKAELGMPKLKKDVKRLVHERMIDFFKSNPGAVKDILNKFQRR
jgi:DNA gyrase subunit B